MSKPISSDPLGSDPLSSDPLSSNPLTADPLASTSTPTSSVRKSMQITSVPVAEAQNPSDAFVPWSSKKISILQEYTTNESIGIQVSFVEGMENVGKGTPLNH